MRRGEALALTWSDIDFKKRLLTVNKNLVFKENNSEIKQSPKTDAGNRIVPIPDKLIIVLEEFRQNCSAMQLFTMTSGDIMSRSSYAKFWAKIKKKIDNSVVLVTAKDHINTPPKNITCHILRHSYATSLYYAGVDIKTAQKLLGHSSISVTMDIYTHLDVNNDDVNRKLTNYLNTL